LDELVRFEVEVAVVAGAAKVAGKRAARHETEAFTVRILRVVFLPTLLSRHTPDNKDRLSEKEYQKKSNMIPI
jgi:hypothetical protein